MNRRKRFSLASVLYGPSPLIFSPRGQNPARPANPRRMDWKDYREVDIPMPFSRELDMRPARWSSVCAALYLLSYTGWNVIKELGETLAEQKKIQQEPNGQRMMRRVFAEYLVEDDLVVYETLPYLQQSVMGVVRLTDFGKTVCRACGWEPVESGWERLIRLHEGEAQPDHTAAVLAIAREARLRGYRADVLPDIQRSSVPARPDLYIIDNQRRRAYVEVETRYHRDKTAKWLNLYQLQGFVAVATKTPSQRGRLIREIKSLRLPGRATDLDCLHSRIAYPHFFMDRWERSGRDWNMANDGETHLGG